MNIISQILIINSYQSVAKIPGVLLENLIVHLESKCFHVLNHKNNRSPGVAFTKRMNLPNIRSKLGKMFHATFHRQSRARKLFLRCKIIIKNVLNAVPHCVGDSIAFQYPFLFHNIIPAGLTGMDEYIFKQSTVNRQPFSRRKLKRFSPNSFTILADTISASLVPFSVSMRSAHYSQ